MLNFSDATAQFRRPRRSISTLYAEREKHMWRIDAAAVALLLFGRFFDKHPPKNEWWHPSTYDSIVERANQMVVDLDKRIDYLLSNNEL